MIYTIHDQNGNLLYNDKLMRNYTPYSNLAAAEKALAKLPIGYYIRDSVTKKKVK